jgi:predicted membrane-bound mannosyltransferase
MPKVYSLDALFLAACVYLLLRWRDQPRDRYLYLANFLYGLSF